MLLEGHTTQVATAESAVKSSTSKEQPRPILASVSETKQALTKEKVFSMQRPEQEMARLCRDIVMKEALTAEERQALQAEHSQQLQSLDSTETIQSQVEPEQVLHLQVITDQDLLPFEERFTCDKPAPEQAGSRKSPTILHSVSHDEQRTVVCEHKAEFDATPSTITIQPQKEVFASLHLHSTQPVQELAKEGLLVIEKPKQQLAAQKQEKARNHAATSEERRAITADYHKDLDVSVTGVKSQLRTEPRPQNIIQVSSHPMQLPKETPFTSDMKQQRALVQREERWNVMHLTSVESSQALEEGHTESLTVVDKFTCQTAVEPKVPTEPVQVEEKEISTESSMSLEAAEQDFAVQIQEGQSVRQSIMMDEKHVLKGEFSHAIIKSESAKISVTTQPKLSLMAPQSEESTALPKELTFVIQIPKPSSVNIRRQLKDALQSAVAREQPLLLADVVGKLEAARVQEVKVQKEPKRAIFTYLVTSSHAPIEISLAFDSEYPQTADLRSELQAAFHSIVCQESQVLTSEQPGTMLLDRPQRMQVISAHPKEMLSSVVESIHVAESTVDFTATQPLAAALKTESNMALESLTAEQQVIIHEAKVMKQSPLSQGVQVSREAHVEFEQSVQVSRQEVRSVKSQRDLAAADVGSIQLPSPSPTEQSVDITIQRESREETFKQVLTLSNPVIVISLQDMPIDEDSMVTFSTTIKYVTKVNWFFNGKLVKSGNEFKCSKDHDTYTLVINKVNKEKHQGEYICEAENEAGKTTTSSRLTVASRGLNPGRQNISHSTCNQLTEPCTPVTST